MNLKPSAALVKRNLSAHSVIGLTIGALMYLVCLTGTLAVFAEEFERWEQPDVAEFKQVTVATIETAMRSFRELSLAEGSAPPDSLYVVFPTDNMPRMHVSGGGKEWLLARDGSLTVAPVEGWTHMLRELHYYLHLPRTFGLIVVSSLGAMLVALIISGLLAHPRIFKDAFRLRMGGSRHLEQADLHNRLSVWGLPFHLMIAITGAFFGLVGLLVVVAAPAFYDGDREALYNDIYGGDPVIDAPLQTLNIEAAMASFQTLAPTASPLYLVAHQQGTRQQYMEIAATLPGRLIYSEIYRFDADGSYLGNQGFADGDASRQIIYSVYRIHFGQFGGLLVKVAYLLLGLALTVIAASGINVWLARRGGRDWVNDAWCAMVWGAPLGLTVAAIASLLGQLPPLAGFMFALVASLLWCLRLRDEKRAAIVLQWSGSIALIALVIGYSFLYTDQLAQTLVIVVNTSLLTLAGVLAWRGSRQQQSLLSAAPLAAIGV